MISDRLKRRRKLVSLIIFVYAILRLVVPTSRRLIAFTSYPDCADNAYALFEYIMRTSPGREFRYVWLVEDVEYARALLDRDHPSRSRFITVVEKKSFCGLLWFLRSRYVFFTHGTYWFARAGFHQTLVNLWHGMPIKNIGTFLGKDPITIPYAHYSVATSDLFADIISQAMLVPRENVIVSGLPRNEWLQSRREPDRGAKKYVVWLPTYRKSNIGEVLRDSADGAADPLSLDTLGYLDEALQASEVSLIIKLHPMDIRNDQVWPTFKNIILYCDAEFRAARINLYNLLGSAEALVTDLSSVAIDFLALEKPIGFFVPDLSEYTRGCIPSVLERVIRQGQNLGSVDILLDFIRRPTRPLITTEKIDELHRTHLSAPSRDLLIAMGLECLSTAARVNVS